MSNKPIIGNRLSSSKNGNSASSTAIVQQRLSKRESTSRLVTTGRVGLVVLLGLASIGMVFTLKHRSVPPATKAPEVNSSQNVPIVATKDPVPKARPLVSSNIKPVKRQAALELLPMPAPEPEQLAIQPRVPDNDSIADKTNPPAAAVATRKSRPDQTVEPNEYEKPVSAIVIDDVRPRNNAAAKLAPTEMHVEGNRPQTFGTKIEFMTDLSAAWVEAMADRNKLVLIVTYAGPFRNGSFVSANAERFRKDCLMNDDVADFLKKNDFECVMQCVSGLPPQDDVKASGNVVTYFCQNDKSVLHAIGGPVDAAEFLRQAYWILAVHKNALADYKNNAMLYANSFRKAHKEKSLEGNDKQRPGPEPRPAANAETQKQIHRLLAGLRSEPLPKFDRISSRIYIEIMKEHISAKE